MKTVSLPNSGSARPPFPDYLALVGDQRGRISRACRAGGPSRLPRCWPDGSTLRTSPRTPVTGASPSAGPRNWRRRCRGVVTTHCCSRIWRRCGSILRSWGRWTSCAGGVQRTSSPRSAPPWTRRALPGGPKRLPPSADLSRGCHRRHGTGKTETAEVEVSAVGESHRAREPGVKSNPEVACGIGEH